MTLDEHDKRIVQGEDTTPDSVGTPDDEATGSSDDRPLFAAQAADESVALEESRDDLALRGAVAAGALGGSGGPAAGALMGFGGALGVNREAGQDVEVDEGNDVGE